MSRTSHLPARRVRATHGRTLVHLLVWAADRRTRCGKPADAGAPGAVAVTTLPEAVTCRTCLRRRERAQVQGPNLRPDAVGVAVDRARHAGRHAVADIRQRADGPDGTAEYWATCTCGVRVVAQDSDDLYRRFAAHSGKLSDDAWPSGRGFAYSPGKVA